MTSGPTKTDHKVLSQLAQSLPASFDPASLLVTSPSLVSIHEGGEHRIVFAHAPHDAAFGGRRVVGLSIREAMSHVGAQHIERFDRVFATGEGDEQPAVKSIYKDADGQKRTRWYRHSLQPWRGSDGQIGGVISHAYDVTDHYEAVEALRKRTAELEFALDVAGGVGSWDWDVGADQLTVNDRFAALFGMASSEAQGLPIARFMDAILPEDRPQVETAIGAAIAAGGDYAQDYRVQTIAGDIRWVTARGRCFLDEQGKAARFSGVVFDITKQVEERREGEQTYALLKSFLDNSASYVFAKDLDGRYLLANQFYLDTFGETEGSLYGRTDRDRFGDMEPYSINDRRVAETGAAMEFEEHAVRADGEVIHAISVKFPLRDSSGVMFGTGSLSTDVTDRKRTEAALAESEERRMRAMTAGKIGTFEYYPADARIVCDKIAASLFGFEDDRAISLEGVIEAIHPDDRITWHDSLAQVREPLPDHGLTMEFRLAGSGNKDRWIEVAGEVVQDSQCPIVFTGTARDITERKGYEDRLRYLNRELNHRVKNLFAVVRGMIRMTARQDPASAPFAQRAVDRIDALAAAHTIGLETEGTEPVDLAELLTAILRPFSMKVGEQIRLSGPPIAIPRRIITPLTLTVYELATNAFKHGALSCSDGKLFVEWTTSQMADETSMLELRWVEDCCEPVSNPVKIREGGLGQRLIDASVAQMSGTRQSEWGETGLHLTFTLPLEITP